MRFRIIMAAALLATFGWTTLYGAENRKDKTAGDKYSIENLTPAIVFISGSVARTEKQNGVDYEVWLRHPETKQFFLKTAPGGGTGFLVSRGMELYLVTASHVAAVVPVQTKVTLRRDKDRPHTVALQDLVGAGRPIRWTHHDRTDVAAIRLDPDRALFEQYLKNHFMTFDILEKEEKAPNRDYELTVIGFPKGLGVTERFSPLLLRARAASGLLQLPDIRRKGTMNTYFILEDPGVGGYSGAPVLDLGWSRAPGEAIEFRGPTKCYGLMHATITDKTGGKLAAVVPSKFIIETIDKARHPSHPPAAPKTKQTPKAKELNRIEGGILYIQENTKKENREVRNTAGEPEK